MNQRTIAVILLIVGLVLAGVSAAADPLGLGEGRGRVWLQADRWPCGWGRRYHRWAGLHRSQTGILNVPSALLGTDHCLQPTDD